MSLPFPQRVPSNWSDESVINQMRSNAMMGLYNGVGITPYFMTCRWYWKKYNCSIVFTRDTAHHSCGWWKNPHFERCWHLSLGFVDPELQVNDRKHVGTTELLLQMFYGDDKRLIWSEPPYSERGKQLDIWHHRLFCSPKWTPIFPKGEVYSREFIPPDWKTRSELIDLQKERALAAEPLTPGDPIPDWIIDLFKNG